MSRDQITTPTPQVPGRPSVDQLADHLEHAVDRADRLQDRLDAIRRIVTPIADRDIRGIYAFDVALQVLAVLDQDPAKAAAS